MFCSILYYLKIVFQKLEKAEQNSILDVEILRKFCIVKYHYYDCQLLILLQNKCAFRFHEKFV